MTGHDWFQVVLFYLVFEAGSWYEKWSLRRAKRKSNAAQGIHSDPAFSWSCPVLHCYSTFSCNDFRLLSKLQEAHLKNHWKDQYGRVDDTSGKTL